MSNRSWSPEVDREQRQLLQERNARLFPGARWALLVANWVVTLAFRALGAITRFRALRVLRRRARQISAYNVTYLNARGIRCIEELAVDIDSDPEFTEIIVENYLEDHPTQ